MSILLSLNSGGGGGGAFASIVADMDAMYVLAAKGDFFYFSSDGTIVNGYEEGSSPSTLVSDGSPCGYMNGQRTTGTAISPFNLGELLRPSIEINNGIAGAVYGSNDILSTANILGTLPVQPCVIGVRAYNKFHTRTSAQQLIMMSGNGVTTLGRNTTSGWEQYAYAGTSVLGSSASVGSAFYRRVDFSGATSDLYLNGSLDVEDGNTGTGANHQYLVIGNNPGATSQYSSDMVIERWCVIDAAFADYDVIDAFLSYGS